MKLRDIYLFVHDDICVYIDDDGEFVDLYYGKTDSIPSRLLDMKVRSIGAKRKGIVDIRIDIGG